MPGGDRSGPWGAGPRTGRAAGYCSGYDVPGYMNPGVGGWYGRGGRWYGRGGGWFGGGRGWSGRGGGWYGGYRGAGRGLLPWGGGRGRAWGGGRGRGYWWRGDEFAAAYDPPEGYEEPPFSPQMTKEQEMAELKAESEYLKNALKDIEKRLGQLGGEGKS